ncbi:MAG: hypothetical protein ACFFDN_10640 [Candidatus Hodarchaeota archaeon]
MVDNHSYSFFGQKVGLIIQSSSKNEPYIFFRLIKSKNNGTWEKPSSGEGKVIKFSLEEIVWIIRVLEKEVNSWSSYHTFKDKSTQISFKWENEDNKKLWIHIDSYSKVLEYSQFKILEMLLKHILKEKIEFATTPSISKKGNSELFSNTFVKEEVITNLENIDKNEFNPENEENSNKIESIDGSIKSETEKALLIQFDNGIEVWIPKSTIHSGFDNSKNILQKFTIDGWILKKNKIIS